MKRNRQGRAVNIEWSYCLICQRKQKANITNTYQTLRTVASNMTEFRYMGELDLEWYAITEMFNENGNRVHVTLYESLKTNNAYILFYISNLLAKAPGLN